MTNRAISQVVLNVIMIVLSVVVIFFVLAKVLNLFGGPVSDVEAMELLENIGKKYLLDCIDDVENGTYPTIAACLESKKDKIASDIAKLNIKTNHVYMIDERTVGALDTSCTYSIRAIKINKTYATFSLKFSCSGGMSEEGTVRKE